MALSKKERLGWTQALFSVLVLWGVSNVFMAFNTQILHVNKIVFACTTYTSCALFLLLYAGKGPLSKETLRSVDTWGYGIIMLINYFVTLNLFAAVTASEASLLQRFSVLVSLLLSWVFLSRKPTKGQFMGSVLIFIGLIAVSMHLPNTVALKVYILMFLAAIFQSLRIFIAELHRPHKKAVENADTRARLRVVGYVMLVITILFLTLTVAFSFLQMSVPAEDRLSFFVTPADFMHAPSIFMGMVMGVFIYAPIRYLEFASSHSIKTENFLAVTSLSFISTLFWEWLTRPFTGLSLIELSTLDIIAGLVITAGAIVMSISKLKQNSTPSWQKYVDYAAQDLERIDDSREILANTLEHYKGDITKAAKALEVEVTALKALLKDSEKVLAFKGDILKEVARTYRRNVAMSDALTGLPNRSAFMTALKGAAYEADVYSLVFIDLNKFKPVNDTYGHDAGDAILQKVAQRLSSLYPHRALVTRLGGDEFVLLLLEKTKAETLVEIEKIQTEIEKPFEIEGMYIHIGASVGVASYPEDGVDGETLLKTADANMYADKDKRER